MIHKINKKLLRLWLLSLFAVCVLAWPSVDAQRATARWNKAEYVLQAGPMIGYAEMREACFWVQTRLPARVRFVYWSKSHPSRRFFTPEALTNERTAYTAKLVARHVEPGRRYTYELHVNGRLLRRPYPLEFQTPALWQHRGEPPSFTPALGSCAYINEPAYDRPGKPAGGDYQVFTSIHRLRPDLMLWLGDNTYLREADWNSRTGILNRYTHTRSLPELQPLLASTHHYAIWDDHDYGPNDSDRSFWNKAASRSAFRLFWPNPSYGIPAYGAPEVQSEHGITTSFRWGDAEFFLLDNRTHRAPNNRRTGERTLLGRQQMEWLVDALTSSRATWKMVAIGGQVPNPAQVFETYANLFPQERAALLQAIADEKIPGVVFHSGDRHHTELSRLERPGTYPLYELTVSPLTSGSHSAPEEANSLRVPSTYVGQRNFGLLSFSGPASGRILRIGIYSTRGTPLWTQEIKATELR